MFSPIDVDNDGVDGVYEIFTLHTPIIIIY